MERCHFLGSSEDLFKDKDIFDFTSPHPAGAAAAPPPPREVVFHTLEPLARLDKKPDRCEISSEDLVRVCKRAEDLRDNKFNKFPILLFRFTGVQKLCSTRRSNDDMITKMYFFSLKNGTLVLVY